MLRLVPLGPFGLTGTDKEIMRPHPRTSIVQKAEYEIQESILTISGKHGLTEIELLKVLNAVQAMTLKYMLRVERHPNDPDRPADAE
jgi:hypothetical protein